MTIADRPIELSSFTTGRMETSHGIRNSFAFDLRRAGSAEVMVAAFIDLPESTVQEGASVELRLPASDRPCARLHGQHRLVLDANAIADLKAAVGSFFYVDAVLTSQSGDPMAAKATVLDRFTLRIRRAKAAAYQAAA